MQNELNEFLIDFGQRANGVESESTTFLVLSRLKHKL